jgi:hypothetical protein
MVYGIAQHHIYGFDFIENIIYICNVVLNQIIYGDKNKR